MTDNECNELYNYGAKIQYNFTKENIFNLAVKMFKEKFPNRVILNFEKFDFNVMYKMDINAIEKNILTICRKNAKYLYTIEVASLYWLFTNRNDKSTKELKKKVTFVYTIFCKCMLISKKIKDINALEYVLTGIKFLQAFDKLIDVTKYDPKYMKNKISINFLGSFLENVTANRMIDYLMVFYILKTMLKNSNCNCETCQHPCFDKNDFQQFKTVNKAFENREFEKFVM